MIYSTFNEYLTKPKSLTFEEIPDRETSWDMKKTSYIGKRLGTLHVTLCL